MLRLYTAETFLRQLSAAGFLKPSTVISGAFSTKGQTDKKVVEDDDTFELLPPGCSMVDPTYGIKDSEPTVYLYDEAANTPPSKTKKVTGKAVPPMPANLAAAKKQLEEKQSVDEEDRYVYLPPGSSMRDPGYNSMSDPLDKRVYYRDPVPSTKKK